MSTLVVGDIHTKTDIVLPKIDKLLCTRSDIDRIVFLGDYVDEWGVDNDCIINSLTDLVAWKEQKDNIGLLTIFLMGNHDKAYLDNLRCSGTRPELFDDIKPLLMKLNDGRYLSTATVVEGKYLASHAGVTEEWFKYYFRSHSRNINEVCKTLNQVSDKEMTWDVGYIRGGYSLPGPLWADKHELLVDPIKGISQIVGHTPATEITTHQITQKESITFCDTFSVTSLFEPIGDRSFALVSKDTIKVVH